MLSAQMIAICPFGMIGSHLVFFNDELSRLPEDDPCRSQWV